MANESTSMSPLTNGIDALLSRYSLGVKHLIEPGPNDAQLAKIAGLALRAPSDNVTCPWLLVDRDAVATLASVVDLRHWTPQYIGYRPTDRDDDVLLYRRISR